MISISVISFNDIRVNRSIFDRKSLYGGRFLGSEIDAFTEKVLEVAELYKTEDYIKDVNNLSQEEIQWKKETISRQIKDEYEMERNKLREKYNGDLDEEKFKQEQEVAYKKIEEKYAYSDEELKKLIVEEKLVNFNKYTKLLNSYDNLKYIAYDKANNIWLTNYKTDKDAITELKKDSGYFSEHHISHGVESKNILINGEPIKDKELIGDYEYYNKGYGAAYHRGN